MSKQAEELARKIVEYLFDDYPDSSEVRGDAEDRVATLIEPYLVGEALITTPQFLYELRGTVDFAVQYDACPSCAQKLKEQFFKYQEQQP